MFCRWNPAVSYRGVCELTVSGGASAHALAHLSDKLYRLHGNGNFLRADK